MWAHIYNNVCMPKKKVKMSCIHIGAYQHCPPAVLSAFKDTHCTHIHTPIHTRLSAVVSAAVFWDGETMIAHIITSHNSNFFQTACEVVIIQRKPSLK